MASTRNAARILAALVLVVLGAFLAISGAVLLWIIFTELFARPKNEYSVHLGIIVLKGGWQVYAAAALFVAAAIGSLVVGFSLFPKRSDGTNNSSTR